MAFPPHPGMIPPPPAGMGLFGTPPPFMPQGPGLMPPPPMPPGESLLDVVYGGQWPWDSGVYRHTINYAESIWSGLYLE